MPLLFAVSPFLIQRLRVPGFISSVVGLLVLYYLVVTAIEKWRVYRTRNWPTAVGVIQDVTAVRKDGGANGVDYWQVLFNYTYTVNGKQYSGKYHVNCATEGIRDEAAAGLPVAQAIVHYSPSDQGHSVLWEDEVWNLW